MANKIEDILITDLDIFARGIAHKNGRTFFIENALPDEICKAAITKENKNFSQGYSTQIQNQSKNRVNPLCPHFNICGGCDTQHICYNQTLEFKKEQIRRAFKKISNEDIPLNFEIVPSEKEYFYRNKISLAIGRIDNKNTLCMYQKNSHKLVKIDSCVICDEKFKILIDIFNQFLEKTSFYAYNKQSKTGELKNLVARIIDNKILVTICVKKRIKLDVKELFEELSKHFNNVGINENINKNDNEILSNNFVHLAGIKEIKFEDMKITNSITNASFLQVNNDISQKLYNYVLNNVSNIVVNAYSGAGLLTCLIAQKLNENLQNSAKKYVFGIEINKEASFLADKLKEKYGLENVKNIQGDANDVLKNLNLKNFTLIVDPPRFGLDDKMIETICSAKPQKIVYVSCGKISLCKNYNQLKSLYEIAEIKAFDMFPQTVNCETVLILKLKK